MPESARITLAEQSNQERPASNLDGKQRGDTSWPRTGLAVCRISVARPGVCLGIINVERPAQLILAVKPVHSVQQRSRERDRRTTPSRLRRGAKLCPGPVRHPERPQIGQPTPLRATSMQVEHIAAVAREAMEAARFGDRFGRGVARGEQCPFRRRGGVLPDAAGFVDGRHGDASAAGEDINLAVEGRSCGAYSR